MLIRKLDMKTACIILKWSVGYIWRTVWQRAHQAEPAEGRGLFEEQGSRVVHPLSL